MNGFSQSLDSLETILDSKNLSTKEYLEVCDDLSWSYLDIDFEKSKEYAVMGIERAKSDQNLKMEARLLRNLGVAYYMNSQMDSAQLFLNSSLKKTSLLNDEELNAAINGALGNVHNVSGNYQEALSCYLKALSVFDRYENKERIRSLLGNIASLYYSLANLSQSEKYFTELEQESVEANDMYNLGRAYDGFSRIAMKRKDYVSSLGYAEKALDIFNKGGFKSSEAIALQGIAMVYYQDYNNYSKAKEYALQALDLTKEIGYDTHVAGSLNILSNIYFKEKDYVNCMKSAREAIETDTTDANVTSNLYANMVRAGIFLNNHQETLLYFDKYRKLIDARSTIEFEKSIAESEKKYQTEKKELRIQMLEKEKILYSIIFFVSIIGLILLLLVFYLRNRTIKTKGELNKQKILQLEKESQLIAAQAVLNGETAERARLARDLHDGLGGMLSAVKLNLYDIKQDVIIEKEDVLRFNKVMEMLDNSIGELRSVAHNMMPEALARYGLKTALSDFCKNFRNVKFHFFGTEQRIEKKLETVIYLAANELINNALKHSGASVVNVQLVCGADLISLNVQDDGRGFDAAAKTSGAGLNNLRTRLVAVNGIINVHSSPNGGTEVDVEIKK
ncbi:MAG: sensor histidine kinase [Fermentimonas sp.]|nr:sensor histidine kinase [Fermentimonas sp.]